MYLFKIHRKIYFVYQITTAYFNMFKKLIIVTQKITQQ